jgi:hypothetical protein
MGDYYELFMQMGPQYSSYHAFVFMFLTNGYLS